MHVLMSKCYFPKPFYKLIDLMQFSNEVIAIHKFLILPVPSYLHELQVCVFLNMAGGMAELHTDTGPAKYSGQQKACASAEVTQSLHPPSHRIVG